MCTILIARGMHPRYPLVVAGNRDEWVDRASDAPTAIEPGIVAGRDRAAGGTWWGVRDDRFLVAITNQRTHHPPDARRRSRGQLALELLRAGSTSDAAALLRRLAPGSVNPANVLFGTVDDLRVGHVRDDATTLLSVPEGTSVLANDGLDSPAFPKGPRLIARARPAWSAPDLDGLAAHLHAALGSHEQPPLEAIEEPPAGSMFDRNVLAQLQASCVHLAGGYGTVSCSFTAFSSAGTLVDWRYGAGSPCTMAWTSVP